MNCYNELHPERKLLKLPGEKDIFICDTYDKCFTKYSKQVEAGYINDDLGYLHQKKAEEDESYLMTAQMLAELQLMKPRELVGQSGDFPDEIPRATFMRSGAERLTELSKSKPLLFASIVNWAEFGRPLSPRVLQAVFRGVETTLANAGQPLTENQARLLHSAFPPQNIRRVLDSCVHEKMFLERVLVHGFKNGVEAIYNFSFQDPVEAAINLHFSVVATKYGPLQDWNEPRCSTGRIPDMAKKVKNFSIECKFDMKDPTKPTIVVGFYSDDAHSASGNVLQCPLWMWDLSVDPSVRFLEGAAAHTLICNLPTSSSIEYQYSNGSGLSATAMARLSKEQRYAALLELKRKALESVLEVIRDAERDGRKVRIDGIDYEVRVLVGQFVCDMKERRIWTGLRRGFIWDCSRCYGFPGYEKPDQASRGLRSVTKDQNIRNEFEESYDVSADKSKTKKAQYREAFGGYGMPLKDESPFTRSANASVYTETGPYELFPVDMLHCKDGVIMYIIDFLTAFFGDNFIAETMRFGNEAIKTGKYSMHIMERAIESLHFIPLAIMFGSFDNDPTPEEREEQFLLVTDLLLVLDLLTDPCPGFVHERLSTAIASLETRVKNLLTVLEKRRAEGHKMTTKMHELFAHVANQARECGLPSAFSTKLFETFHELLKRLYQLSSHRVGNGTASRRSEEHTSELQSQA